MNSIQYQKQKKITRQHKMPVNFVRHWEPALPSKVLKAVFRLFTARRGCATYIRRYLISHYKEPIDIASSNFTEDATIFGGDENFKLAVLNIINQYKPEIIGIASTCLSETIGDDVSLFLHHFLEKHPEIGH